MKSNPVEDLLRSIPLPEAPPGLEERVREEAWRRSSVQEMPRDRWKPWLAVVTGMGLLVLTLWALLYQDAGNRPDSYAPSAVPGPESPVHPDANHPAEKPQRAPDEWSTYHGGFNLDGVARTTLPDKPVRLWRFKAGDAVAHTPVGAGGKVFFSSKGRLFAVDGGGQEVWKADLGEDAFSAPFLYSDGTLVAGSDEGFLHAFDAEDGKKKWAYSLGDVIQGSANRVDLADGRKGVIVISQSDGAIHCVDLGTGKKIWQTEPLERCDGSASVGEGRIVMGSCASALHVFSARRRGKERDIELGGDAQVAGGVALAGNLAYVGTRSGKVYAVDVVAGKVVWENSDGRGETFTTPAVSGKFVVFGSDDGKVYGLDRATGAKAWEFETDGSPSSPVIAGNRIALSSNGWVFLLDLETGAKIWSVRVADEVTSPAVVDGRIIVGADDGTVTAFGAP